MATTLIGTAASTYTHSVVSTQSGINVESWSASVEPEFREDLLNISGHVAGQAIGALMTTITITGETIRSSAGGYLGVLLDNFTDDQTAGLSVSAIDVPSGGPVTQFHLQSSEITQTRGSFETGTVVYIAREDLDDASP